MSTPVITIFVRHGFIDKKPCRYSGEEFSRKCKCPKHLRWTLNGKQYRQKTGSRSWEEAEKAKRKLEDQLSGKTPTPEAETEAGRFLPDAVTVFLQDKSVQDISKDVLGKYERELARLRSYCEGRGTFTVQGLSRELLTGYAATWESAYPSSTTRSKVRERCRSFLRYCYEAQWLERIPQLPKVKIDEVPTMPLSTDEYARLLAAVPGVVKHSVRAARARALFQLMRYSGLAIEDALTLKRAELEHSGLYRVVTSRQKTGVHVCVPIPASIAQELLAVPNKDPKFFFWSGELIETLTRKWSRYYVAPVFKAAKLDGVCFATSHRLRDTFAVELLQKGVPMEEVSKLLGHTSIKTTEKHYAKWVQGRQDRLDSLVTGTWAD